jgi:hypothetical protein
MALAKFGGVTLVLIMIAIAMLVLVKPMTQAVEATLPMTEDAMLVVWDSDIDLMMQTVVVDLNYSHALQEHPDTAQKVWDCLKTKGQYAAFQIEPGKRFLRTCLIDDATIGFQIVDIVGKTVMEKTAYIKDGIKSAKELFEYVRRIGYPKFTKPF